MVIASNVVIVGVYLFMVIRRYLEARKDLAAKGLS